MIASERGGALVLTIMITMLVVGLGAALLLVTALENTIEAHHAEAHAVRQAADAGLACAIVGLQGTADWGSALDGSAMPPACLDGMPGWATTGVDVSALTAEVRAAADGRYGASPDRPSWVVWMTGGAPAAPRAPAMAVLTWVADDPHDGDGDPARDANGRVAARVAVLGPRGARATVEALLWRDPAGGGEVVLVGWRALR
jgi:hypothetical protein